MGGPLAAGGPAVAAVGELFLAAAFDGLIGALLEAMAVRDVAAGAVGIARAELMMVFLSTASCCPVV